LSRYIPQTNDRQVALSGSTNRQLELKYTTHLRLGCLSQAQQKGRGLYSVLPLVITGQFFPCVISLRPIAPKCPGDLCRLNPAKALSLLVSPMGRNKMQILVFSLHQLLPTALSCLKTDMKGWNIPRVPFPSGVKWRSENLVNIAAENAADSKQSSKTAELPSTTLFVAENIS
jgi:hypothetical protein